jgi:PST family polysaccharide transporter
MALYGIVHAVHTSQGWLHLAIGRPDRWRNWTVFAAGVQAVAVFAGLPFGPIGVASAISIAGSLIAFPSVTYAGKSLGITAASAFHAVKPQLVGAILTVGLGWYFQATVLSDFSGLVRLILSSMFCGTVFLLIVVVLFRCTEPVMIVFRFLHDHWLSIRRSRS